MLSPLKQLETKPNYRWLYKHNIKRKTRFSTHFIHFTKYFERGRKRKWIQEKRRGSCGEREREREREVEDLGDKVKPQLGLLNTRSKRDGFLFIIKL